MKKTLGFSIICLLLLFVIIWYNRYSLFNCSALDLSGIKWVNKSGNNTILFDLNGSKIVEGNIELWADYPYLYGVVQSNNKISWFVYSVKTQKTIIGDSLSELEKKIIFPTRSGSEKLHFSKEISDNSSESLLVSFHTLKSTNKGKAKLDDIRFNLK